MGASAISNIERLAAGDAERLRAIRLRALGDAPDAFDTTLDEAATLPAESWTRQLEQLATFVASVAGCDLGLARGARHDHLRDAGYLISMWVAPEARRQGIGSALVDAVVHWARMQAFSRLFLDVGERNTSAVAFYARKGFIPNGEVGTLRPPRQAIREIRLVRKL